MQNVSKNITKKYMNEISKLWDKDKLNKERKEKEQADKDKGFSPQIKRILMDYDKDTGYNFDYGYYY